MLNNYEISDEYVRTLSKFASDCDILILLDECIKDSLREREIFFVTQGRYPDTRNELMKLKFDLIQRIQLLKRGE